MKDVKIPEKEEMRMNELSPSAMKLHYQGGIPGKKGKKDKFWY